MFTGIVEEVGAVQSPAPRLRVKCSQVLNGTREGASIAVNGVCLTATAIDPDGFSSDVSPETLARTNLGALREGAPVNLERPAAVGDRLNGHIVQGHVDGVAEVASLDSLPDGNWWLKVRVPREMNRYLVHKGSVTVDGVSLTVAALEDRVLSVAIIPHTYRNTIVHTYRPGARVNIEVDVVAKYVEKLLAERG